MYNLLDKGLFLKNRPRLAKKRSVRPSSRLKTVDLDYRSSLSVARLVRFWFKSLQILTVHDRQFLQGNLFLLAVCTHAVGLYLCSIFCTRSLLQFSAASYRAFGAWNTPQLYLVTLNKKFCTTVFLTHTVKHNASTEIYNCSIDSRVIASKMHNGITFDFYPELPCRKITLKTTP